MHELTPEERVESRRLFHDHDCVLAYCKCICGCQDGPFCVVALGPLCPSCAAWVLMANKVHGAA